MSAVAPILLCLITGCASTGAFTPPWKKSQAKLEGPKDTMVLNGFGMERIVVDDAA
ncbi:MAG: hypothetical protein HYR84_00185, partial [Planctomycetes bacterium]|nr:hypothetical protein [Planctomycetota bacterium]